ncbi:Uncharacterised protein [Acinetobacter baumannii]|nr:Uncharacterised protein [Acinetobacter baumannii]
MLEEHRLIGPSASMKAMNGRASAMQRGAALATRVTRLK